VRGIRGWLRALFATSRSDPCKRHGCAPGTVFRHIDISHGRRIELGAPFAFDAISTAIGEHERELLPGEFGGAESIVIELTPARIVRGMRFGYAAGTSFRRMVDGYKEMLGLPAVEAADTARWETQDTTFELRREPGPTGRVCSRLAHRA
jgi:hypothetical protein